MPKRNEMDVPSISCLPCTIHFLPLTSHAHPSTPSTPLCPAHAPCSIAPHYVPSCPTMSCRISPCPIMSHCVLLCPTASYHVSPCPAASRHVPPCLTMSHYVLLFLMHVTGMFGAHRPPVVAVIPHGRSSVPLAIWLSPRVGVLRICPLMSLASVVAPASESGDEVEMVVGAYLLGRHVLLVIGRCGGSW